MITYALFEKYSNRNGVEVESLVDVYRYELDAREEAELLNKLLGFSNDYTTVIYVVREKLLK